MVATLAPRRQLLLGLAQREFPSFLEWVITENDEGYPLPAPVSCEFEDPLQPLIDENRLLARPQRWPHVEEMARDVFSGKSLIYLKARQMWFSWMISAYAVYTALQRGNVFVLSQGQEYADEVIRKCKFIHDRLPPELQKKTTKDNTRELAFRGAGAIKSFPSTEDAVRSLSGRLVIVDEAAFHTYAGENYRAYRPSVAGSGGQLIMISTANGPTGFFPLMFENARNSLNDYDWRFYPWSARPDHDRDWYEREERAYAGFISNFRRENPTTIEEAFSQTQGLVYPSFNSKIHVSPPKVPFEQCRWRGAGVDWGGSPGNPNAALVMGVTLDGHLNVYDELLVRDEASTERIGQFLSRWRQRAPFSTVECDWNNDDGIRMLVRTYGLPAKRALKKRSGIDMLDTMFRNNAVSIDTALFEFQSQLQSYRWSTRIDPNSKEKYLTSTPVDHHGDLIDCARYFLQRIWRDLGITGSQSQISNVSGRAPARYAV